MNDLLVLAEYLYRLAVACQQLASRLEDMAREEMKEVKIEEESDDND